MDFRPRLNSIAVIVLAGFAIYLVASWIALYRAPALHYSELSALIQKDQVASIEVRPHALLVRLKQPKNGKLEFLTERVDLTLANELDKHGIHYYATEDHDDTWSWLLWAALPIAALIMLRGTMSAGVSTRSDPLSIA
ncbi:MAG TPA: hypothetical protein VFN67_29135, partial [Polyangiales bacterium]|nr:hypothetical protein [Polyangiales bacterium]